MSKADPRAEYERRRELRQRAVDAQLARSRRFSNLRVLTFVVLLALVGAGLSDVGLPLPWALVPLVIFVGLVIAHEGIERSRARAALAVDHYDRALRRLDDRWQEDGPSGEEHVPHDHIYAADLDLFGPASLFTLLCTARTRGGESTLAGWLLAPATPAEIRARQAASTALRERLDLREDLALLGGDLDVAVDPEHLRAWGEAPPQFAPDTRGPLRALAWILALAATAALVAWLAFGASLLPLAVVMGVEVLVGRRLKPATEAVTKAVEAPRRELDVVARLLARVGREDLSGAPRLAELQRRMISDGTAGAAAIAELARLVDWLESRRNALFAPLAFAWMWELHCALAIEGWRARHGASIAPWLAALSELEALLALATYTYERPEDPLPEILEATGGPQLIGEALRHPLLPGCVANSVDLGAPLRVLMVSGSNMSGKSTLLRTVGVNVVLALAGAPIRGASLRLSPLAVGATLRVEDSLREASSRFYAELHRLKLLMDEAQAGDPPLLFLLDEIFHGTNSHDRKIGAEAVIRALVRAGAVGLVTTHDLALAEAITDLGEQAVNVHFQDEVVDGRLRFDYRMRPGIVRRSNALELMRAVGLEV
jgi:hypothetical protein